MHILSLTKLDTMTLYHIGSRDTSAKPSVFRLPVKCVVMSRVDKSKSVELLVTALDVLEPAFVPVFVPVNVPVFLPVFVPVSVCPGTPFSCGRGRPAWGVVVTAQQLLLHPLQSLSRQVSR